MTALLTPSAPQAIAPTVSAPPPSLGRFLAGYVRLLLPPLGGLVVLLIGWTQTQAAGWPVAAAAVAGWSAAVVAWLRRRGWPAATANLAAWAAPAWLLAPLAGLGWLSADGLLVWGPASAVAAVALTAVHDPRLVSLPARTRRTR